MKWWHRDWLNFSGADPGRLCGYLGTSDGEVLYTHGSQQWISWQALAYNGGANTRQSTAALQRRDQSVLARGAP